MCVMASSVMRRGNVFPWFELEDIVGSDLLDRVILHCTRLTLAVTINVCPERIGVHVSN